MATSIRERAIALLGQNIQQSLVASAVGVSESYISQLLEEPAVAQEVAALKAKKLEEAVAKDDSIESLETLALAKLKSALSFGTKSPLEAARVFQILNSAKRKTTDTPTGDGSGQSITITLPKVSRASIQIQLNAQNQVIEVEGRSMATLPSKALPQLVKNVKAAEDAAVKALPAPTAKTDTQVAMDKLRTLPEITTMMDGVQLVL